MSVCIIFVIISLISSLIGFKKGLVKTGISFLGKVITFVISFIITRILVNSLSIKVGKEIAKVVKKEFDTNLFEISTIEEFLRFISSIVIGVALFYIVYSIISIIIAILKHVLFGDKDDSNVKLSPIVSKILIVIICVCSTSLSFMMMLTPIGVVYNPLSDSISDKFPVLAGEKLPFVSETYFNKLTEMPDNENDIEATKEIDYTVNLALSAVDIYQKDNRKNGIENFKENFENSYFLPTVIGEVGSSAAEQWKNGDDYLGMKFEIVDGREGDLQLKFLNILEQWNKKAVVEDVSTILNVLAVVNDYGTKKMSGENALLEALADETFTEELFVVLYINKDFSQLVPAVIEYGLGTAFDFMDIDVNEGEFNEMIVSNMSEEDARQQARLVSETIKTILKIQETAKEINNNQLSEQDIANIIEDLEGLKDDKVLGDVAEELINQLDSNLVSIQY